MTDGTALLVLCAMLLPSCLIRDLACMSYVSAFGIVATAGGWLLALFERNSFSTHVHLHSRPR